jgi:predicted exporter
MNRSPAALLLLALWVAGLAGASLVAQRHLSITSDLRLFLPAPITAEQRLLVEGIGDGPAARVLAVALKGAPPEELADASRALVDALRGDEMFSFVANGDFSFDALPDALLPYRFLLSPTLDSERFDESSLRAALTARARDLASPAGLLLEPWLPRDPTLELPRLLELWQPTREPRREFDVWFDRSAQRALLLAETRAPAFDPDRQRAAIERLEAALAAVAGGGVEITVTGAGQSSVLMEQRTRSEAQRLGTIATIGMLVLLLLAYRSFGAVLLSALPLSSAGLAGAAAVGAIFGSVHGITVAFGITLIGVAQDYPLHVLSHQRRSRTPSEITRELWPTLATGVVSTCVAYLTFLFSGVTGLQQLACFTVAGLAVAGLSTRFVLPRLIGGTRRDHGQSPALARLWHAFAGWRRPRWLPLVLAAGCLVVAALARTPLWDDDLQGLTPVPAPLLAADRELRDELGTADLRYLLAVDARDEQSALASLETLEPQLTALVQQGAIADFDSAARYLPSAATQLKRQAALPEPAQLRVALASATASTPFRPDAFDAFVDDVTDAKTLPPLRSEDLRAHGLGQQVDMLLRDDGQGGRTALVTLAGVADVAALAALANAAGGNVALLDLKRAAETLVAQQRTRILWSLAVAAILLVAVVATALRKRERVLRVLAPMALATLIVVATMQAAGVPMTLFHLIALILAAGLGLDYALFFERPVDDAAEQLRTLHAIIVCSLSTFLVFALLATSSLPVLRAIGLPVAIGVVANFVLALLLTPVTRRPGSPASAERAPL